MAIKRRPASQEDNLAPTRVISNLKNIFSSHAPEDELEPIEDISSVSQPPPEPIETDMSEVMAVLQPHRRPMPPKEVTEEDKPPVQPKPQTRVRIFTAATPDQLVEKVNGYLAATETDPRLQNLTLVSTDYTSNNQGYSVMLTYKLT